MGLKNKNEGVELARNIIRDWPDTTLLGKRPHQIVAAFGISLQVADAMLKEERRRRNL
jgi:hypothetical protein